MSLKNRDLLSGKATVAIIGAGPVGLTMARLLQQKGMQVTVYERDKDAQTRIWGGTLDLHKGTGQEALRHAGLLEKYYASAIPMGRTVTDAQGRILLTRNTKPEEQHDNPEINRNDLRTLLLDSLTPNTVIWDKKLMGLEQHSGKWLLHFENDTAYSPKATADVVIGANGGMSSVRKQVTDDKVEATGTFIIQGDVVQPGTRCASFYEMCNSNILMTAHEGNLLVANPINGNVLSYSIIFKMPEKWIQRNELDFQNTEGIRAFLSNRLSHWHESYQQLFHSTSSFVGLPTKKISLDKPWKEDRPLPVTLIGDAAHLMPPFAGQGVNIGLMDAVVLCDNLINRNFQTVQAAIRDYEQKMIVYATAAQWESSKNERAMHDPDFSFLKFYH